MNSVNRSSSAAVMAQMSNRDSHRGTPVKASELDRYAYRSEMKTALEICKDLNTPRSMAVWYLLSEDSPESIIQLLNLPPVSASDGAVPFPVEGFRGETQELIRTTFKHVSVHGFANDYLVSEMMVKNPSLNSGIDRKAAAYEKFHKQEAECAITNERLIAFQCVAYHPYRRLIKSMQRTVSKVLGKLSSRKLRTAEQGFSFGPGATSAVSGADVLLSKKYACEMHVTPRLFPYARAIAGYQWCSFPGTDIIVSDESRTTTVAKNAKTDRIIAIEPHMNILVQKGIGDLIREQLGYFGVDLNTQQWNQYLAGMAQDWSLSTIDLKGASDSVSYRLVKLLLPREWFELLELCRTDFTVCDGARVPLSKFSSMGNGYTFELESLIFYAACVAVGANKHQLAVYGDDIIVEKRVAEPLIDLLEFIGFKTNTEKTFLEGSFFESCGSDWHNGINVRPFYLKGDYNDETECNLYIPNVLRRYAHRRGLGSSCDRTFKKAWVSAYRRASDLQKRTAIPDGSGDEGFVRNWDEARPSLVWSKDYQTWQAMCLPLRAVRSKNTDPNGAYVAALHKGAELFERSTESIRGRVRRSSKLRSRPTFGWVDLGPWS